LCCSCGCLLPATDHSDSDNITLDDLNAAAEAAGITTAQAAQNIVDTISSLVHGDDDAPSQPQHSFALDVDGTINAAPAMFATLMRSLKAGGAQVTVLTANKDAGKILASLGMADCYDAIVHVDGEGLDEIAEAKRSYCQSAGVDLCVDDTSQNVVAVSQVTNAAMFVAAQGEVESEA
jgi:hypothetical protein